MAFDKTNYKDECERLESENSTLKQEIEDRNEIIRQKDIQMDDLKRGHVHAIKDLEKTHELAIKDMQFKLDHLESEELKKSQEESADLKLKLAVANETVAQLEKVVDLSADIIDVGEVVNKLIEKLPTLNISSLNLSTSKEESKK